MSKQKIEVDVPDGWRIKEVVHRVQMHGRTNSGAKSYLVPSEGAGYLYFTAILEQEPIALQLATAVLQCKEPATLVSLARKVVDEYERGQK